NGGYVSFGQGGCKITDKGTIKTGKLEFEKVYFVKDLKYNLFSVSQICDNQNSVLFTDSECIVLGIDFKIRDDTNVLLRTPRQHNMYSIDLNNIVPDQDLTCLVAKASADDSELWHRRLGHLNFKIMNRLVRHNLVKGLPSKCFDNDHTCVACLKGKQHKASCKTKSVNSVSKPLHTLHMDLFGPASDETGGILRNFITEIENLKDLKVKIIRCDNRGEFKNKEMNDFCSRKGIKKEFSNARTPQQIGVAERRNRTLIEVARTMLAYAKLPVTFWAEAVNTAWKFKAKGDEGYFIGYSMSSKAFRVFNKTTKRVEENLHVDFLENKLIEKGAGPNWLFNIDTLTNSMNYVPVVSAGTTSTNFSSTMEAASQDVKKDVSSLRYIALPNWFHEAHSKTSTSNAQDACKADAPKSSGNSNPTASSTNPLDDQMETLTMETPIPTVRSPVPTACLDDSPQLSSDTRLVSKRVTSQDDTPSLDNILTLSTRFEDILRVTINTGDTNGVEADLCNMENNISTSPTPTFRIHKDHPTSQIIGYVDTPVQTRNKSKEMQEQSFIASIHHITNPDLLQFCLFSCFLSQEEPKKISDALKDPSIPTTSDEFPLPEDFPTASEERFPLLRSNISGTTRIGVNVVGLKVSAVRHKLLLFSLTNWCCSLSAVRVRKGFSGVETPLFEGMLVEQVIKEGGDAEEHVQDVADGDATQGDDTAVQRDDAQEPTIPSPTPPTPPPQPPQDLPSTSQEGEETGEGNRVRVLKLRRLKKVGTSQRIDTSEDTVMDDASNQGRIIDELDKDDVVALMDDKEVDKKEEEAKLVEDDQVQGRQAESQAKIYKIDMDHASKVLSMHEDEPAKVQEVVDVVTTAKLITEVITAANTIISTAKPQVPAATITVAPIRVAAASTRRRKGVVIRDPREESTTSSVIHADTKSKDKGKGIMVEKPKPLKKKQQVEMDEKYARKLHAECNKDIDWDVAIDQVKKNDKDDPAVQRYQVMKRKPQTEAQA
nr:hypothetical protein [Tanacetum cinerariifolium]